jgi:hypothetical protein
MRIADSRLLLLLALLAAPATAADPPAAEKHFPMVIWNCRTDDLAGFERAAAQASKLGATHMVVTSDLPYAFWEYDTPGDPYPAWYVYRTGLLKAFPPPEVSPYIPAEYTKQIQDILAARCAILAKYGLKGVFASNEPQVLPEAAFRDHPPWRGPRVDQPNRSRVARFAPAVDEPEVLALYRQSLALLVKRCPQIDLFQFLTTDSGSGLDWAPSLYPGINGPARFKNRPMTDRVRDFLTAMQQGARDGGGEIQIRMYQITPEEWMTPTFADPQGLARQLPPGLAINNFQSGDAAPFIATAGNGEAKGFFYPIRGIPNPVELAAGLRTAWASPAPRLSVNVPMDCDDLYARLFGNFAAHPAMGTVQQDQLLLDAAAQQVGSENAEDLLGVWQAVAKVMEVGDTLKWCFPFNMGGVHQRWITRPFVPFPLELAADQKAYYRKFIFEARSEVQAEDLVDNQAMELYKGWPGRMWITNVFNDVEPRLRTARQQLARIIGRLGPGAALDQCRDLDLRLQMALCLCTNARDAVNYQAVLDYIKGRNQPPETDPPLGTGPGWDRQMILQIARDEIDNSAAMIDLLKRSPRPVLDCAKTGDAEDIMLLGPEVAAQLKIKIDIMNAHWEDYKRITTTPNP